MEPAEDPTARDEALDNPLFAALPDDLAVAAANRRSGNLLDGPRVLLQALGLVWASGPLLLVLVSGLAVVGAGLTLVQLAVVQALVGRLVDLGSGRKADVVSVLLALVAITVVSQLASASAGLWQRLLGQRTLRRTAGQVLDVTSSVPLVAFEDPTFFSRLVWVQQNGFTQPMIVAQALAGLVAGGLSSIALVGFILSVAPALLPLLAISAVPVYLTSRRSGRLEFDYSLGYAERGRRRIYVESLLNARQHAREVRSFESAGGWRRRWESMWGEELVALSDLVRRRLRMMVLSALASALAVAAVGLYLAHQLTSGGLEVSRAGAAVVAMRLLASRVEETARGLSDLVQARIYLDDLQSFIKDFPSEPPAVQKLRPPDDIHVSDVAFTYPGGTRPALSDVDLHIRRGQLVALVGENGSGKTTLAGIIAGLFEPGAGEVLWDGAPVSREGPEVREHITAVFQDFVRYELTVAENVTAGQPVDEELVSRALSAGGASFLFNTTNGLDTMLSQQYVGGRNLSVGQWQRLAVARAFYRDRPIMVLDEPTSAMDARAEADLFARLRVLWSTRTVVVVSHRFSTVRDADLIVVLHDGRVEQQGSHDELIAEGGRYRELYELQAAGYAERTPRSGQSV